MAFSLKTWVNRISEYPNRRKLTHEDGSTELVTVARAEGQISAEGNAFSAEEMNDLENRIKGGFDEVNQSLADLFIIKQYRIEKTIPANGNINILIDNLTNYTPYGAFYNCETDETSTHALNPRRKISSKGMSCCICNTHTSSINTKGDLYILYLKQNYNV